MIPSITSRSEKISFSQQKVNNNNDEGEEPDVLKRDIHLLNINLKERSQYISKCEFDYPEDIVNYAREVIQKLKPLVSQINFEMRTYHPDDGEHRELILEKINIIATNILHENHFPFTFVNDHTNFLYSMVAPISQECMRLSTLLIRDKNRVQRQKADFLSAKNRKKSELLRNEQIKEAIKERPEKYRLLIETKAE